MNKEEAIKVLMETDLDKLKLDIAHIAALAAWAINHAKPALQHYSSLDVRNYMAWDALEAFPKDEK